MADITIERVDQLTLQLGDPTDPGIRALLERIAKNTTPVAFELGTIAPAGASSLPTPPAFGEVWTGQGGRLVGILPALGDRPAQYMVASDAETSVQWGPRTDVQGARSRHDGRANTAALAGDDFPAAQWCRDHRADGHDDFHLPSQLEMFLASIYAPQVFEKEGWYWTSTQLSSHGAFIQDFEFGDSLWYFKDYVYRVRAVRWIQLQHFDA